MIITGQISANGIRATSVAWVEVCLGLQANRLISHRAAATSAVDVAVLTEWLVEPSSCVEFDNKNRNKETDKTREINSFCK